jgi:hypothetical protein
VIKELEQQGRMSYTFGKWKKEDDKNCFNNSVIFNSVGNRTPFFGKSSWC